MAAWGASRSVRGALVLYTQYAAKGIALCTGHLIPRLRGLGIAPQDIDTVLITHVHPDHMGGLLDAQDNLVFPNVRYFVAQQERDFWLSADPSTVDVEALRHHLELLVKNGVGA